MRISMLLAAAIVVLATAFAGAQTLRLDRDGGFSFKFGREDRRGDVEGKRASCEVYARIAVVQADANTRFRCGLRGPAWAERLRGRTSSGAGLCRAGKLPKNSAIARSSCSAASTSSAISTTTVGAADLSHRNGTASSRRRDVARPQSRRRGDSVQQARSRACRRQRSVALDDSRQTAEPPAGAFQWTPRASSSPCWPSPSPCSAISITSTRATASVIDTPAVKIEAK